MLNSILQHLLNSIPLKPQAIIQLLYLGIWIFAAATMAFIIWGAALRNSLSVRSAKTMLREKRATVAPLSYVIPHERAKKTTAPKKPKRNLVSFTLTEESENLLKQVTEIPSLENGWAGYVQENITDA